MHDQMPSSEKTKLCIENGGWEDRAKALQRENEELLEDNLSEEVLEEIRGGLYRVKHGVGRDSTDGKSIATADSMEHKTGCLQTVNKTETPSSSTDFTRIPKTNSILHQTVTFAMVRKSLTDDLQKPIRACRRARNIYIGE